MKESLTEVIQVTSRIPYADRVQEAHLNLNIIDASLAVIETKSLESFTPLEAELLQELDKIKQLSTKSVREETRVLHKFG
jgi:hypothetical protein